MIKKQETIAETMRQFMASGPSVETYPTYKSLNDYVGKIHGLAEGKCQALAGEKAWIWTADPISKRWRKATNIEFENRKAKAAAKNHGTRRAKVLSDKDRVELELQIKALEEVANPHLAPVLVELQDKLAADDLARKGSLKDRLAACVDRIGVEKVVDFLEKVIADYDAETAAAAAETAAAAAEDAEAEDAEADDENA